MATATTKTVVAVTGDSEGHGHRQQSNHCGSGRNSGGGDSNVGYGCDGD
jgi:hypothetical protein